MSGICEQYASEYDILFNGSKSKLLVLGARLYSMYAYPMSTIIVKHNLQYHSYADDTQIYLQCENTDDAIRETINRLEKCIMDVSAWMKKNSLKINEDKT